MGGRIEVIFAIKLMVSFLVTLAGFAVLIDYSKTKEREGKFTELIFGFAIIMAVFFMWV